MANNLVANPGAGGATFKTTDNAGVHTPHNNVDTVPADPFGANADAASATGSISAKLRFIAATGIPITGTVTVSGTVTTTPPSNASTNLTQLAGTAVDVNSGVKSAGTLRVVIATDQPQLTNKLLVTPDSVALPANQSVNISQLAGTTTDTNSGVKSAGTLRVVIATDQPQLTNKLLVTPDSVALPANQSVNVAQLAGTTTDTNSGNKSAGTLRVVVATDQPQLTNALKVDGSAVTQPTQAIRSGTGTTSQVADNAASTTILASNANRLGATIENDSTATLYLKMGTTASLTDYTVQVVTNAYYEVPYGYTGRIDGIWATDPNTGSARVTEFT